MPPKPTPNLQPLQIPTGWYVEWNIFLNVEPIFEAGDNISVGFSQDLLQISNKKSSVLLDLGWYPDHDPGGAFRLLLIRTYPNEEEMRSSWGKPLRFLDSRSKTEIVQAIEDWLWHFSHHSK